MRDHLPMSERLFIFDVDGTLTPSRQKMDMEFQKYFMDFCEDNFVYLITGSDRKDTRTSWYRHILHGRQSLQLFW